MIELDQIAPLQGPRPDGAPKVRRHAPTATAGTTGLARRSVLGGVAATGGSLGLMALGVFPPVRKALAQGYSLREYYDVYSRCPSYASSHDCSPGCGPSRVCADCCRTSGSRKGWHKSSASDPGRYKLRPNQCYQSRYDAWIWHYAHPCGNCAESVTFRCHDGWKKSSGGTYFKTICRWALACES